MIHSAVALADYILTHGRSRLDILQIIKLAYICHGWNLALHDEPLIGDEIEAWPYGPVIPTLYHALRVHRKSPVNRLVSCDMPLSDPAIGDQRSYLRSRFGRDERLLIEEVLDKYGGFSGPELSAITHERGTPWSKSYDGMPFTRIQNDVIKEHYQSLLHA